MNGLSRPDRAKGPTELEFLRALEQVVQRAHCQSLRVEPDIDEVWRAMEDAKDLLNDRIIEVLGQNCGVELYCETKGN